MAYLHVRQTLDHRFLWALVALVLVLPLVLRGIHADQRQDDLVRTLQRQVATNERQQRSLQAARESAAAQRSTMLAIQRDLARQVDRVERRQERLLRYLQDHQVTVPLEFQGRQESATPNKPRVRAGRPARPKTVPSEQDSSSPAPAPSPAPSPNPNPVQDLLDGLLGR